MFFRTDVGVRLLALGALLGCSSATDSEQDRSTATDIHPDSGENDTDSEGSDSEQTTDDSYEKTGICGMSIQATVTVSAFDGSEDIYLIGEEGEGDDICRVRYTVRSVGAPAVSCDICEWAFEIERTAPEITANVDAGCALSELGMDTGRIEERDGARVSWGYAAEATGHAHVLMELNETTGQWTPVATAAWSESESTLTVDRRDGYCGY